MKGKFIVIEGIDGCGKSTQVDEIFRWLPNSGLMNKKSLLIKTREPGGTLIGRKLRKLILSNEDNETPSNLTELLLYSADRAEHISKIISPALNKGNWIISDRFAGSTLAYQGYGRSIDKKIINNLENIASQGEKPDITFLLKITPEESIARRVNKTPDRIESEGINFLRKVDYGFNLIAKARNWEIIQGNADIIEISNKIKKVLIDKLSN
tara:strand:- start:949 stop:1581 length:633 start_codon:yes stop_codon:yes gene_type:complete